MNGVDKIKVLPRVSKKSSDYIEKQDGSKKRKAELQVTSKLPTKKLKIEYGVVTRIEDGVLTRLKAREVFAKRKVEEKQLFDAIAGAKLCFSQKQYGEAEKKARIGIENSRFLNKPNVELYYILSLVCYIQKKFDEVEKVVKDALQVKSFSSDEMNVLREILRLTQFERDKCDVEKYIDEIIMEFPSMEWQNRARLHCVLFDIIYSFSGYRASIGILNALRYVQYINDSQLRDQVIDRLNKYENLKLVEEYLSSLKKSEKCDISKKYLSDALNIVKLVNTKKFYFY